LSASDSAQTEKGMAMFEEEKRTDNKPFDLEIGAWVSNEYTTSTSVDLLPWENGKYSIASFIVTSKNIFIYPLFAFKDIGSKHVYRSLAYTFFVAIFQMLAIIFLASWMYNTDILPSLSLPTKLIALKYIELLKEFMAPKLIYILIGFILLFCYCIFHCNYSKKGFLILPERSNATHMQQYVLLFGLCHFILP